MTLVKISNQIVPRVMQESEQTSKELELFRASMEAAITTLGQELVTTNELLVKSRGRYQQLNLACEEEMMALNQELADLELLLKHKDKVIADNTRDAQVALQTEVTRTATAVNEASQIAQRSAAASLAAVQQNYQTQVAQARASFEQQLQAARSNTASYENNISDARNRLNNNINATNNAIHYINAALGCQDMGNHSNVNVRVNHNSHAQTILQNIQNDLNQVINNL